MHEACLREVGYPTGYKFCKMLHICVQPGIHDDLAGGTGSD
jgi:hypothetical protein